MKAAIVYYSQHHGNTKKLIDAIAGAYPVTLIDAAENSAPELRGYDLVGFASGIYFSKFHELVLSAVEGLSPGTRVFLLYTCGTKNPSYTSAITQAVQARQAQVIGSYGCRGYDTFGPFKLIGGIAKKHPTQEELRAAVDFYGQLAVDEGRQL